MKTVQIEKDVTIKYKPIPPLAVSAIQTNYTKKHPKPEKPTYTFEAAGGVKIEQEHDETSISPHDGSKELWDKYIIDNNIWQSGLTERLMLLFLVEGIEIDVTDKKKRQWNKRLERYYDLEDLEDDDIQLLYLQTFVFKTPKEIENATKIIMGLTGVSDADLEAAENLF